MGEIEVVERDFVSEFERRRQTLISSQQELAGLRQQLSGRLADADQARASEDDPEGQYRPEEQHLLCGPLRRPAWQREWRQRRCWHAVPSRIRFRFRAALLRHGIEQSSDLARQLETVRTQQQRKIVDLTGGNLEGISIGELSPRTGLYRETLLAKTEAMIGPLDDDVDGDLSPISRFIGDYIAGPSRSNF